MYIYANVSKEIKLIQQTLEMFVVFQMLALSELSHRNGYIEENIPCSSVRGYVV